MSEGEPQLSVAVRGVLEIRGKQPAWARLSFGRRGGKQIALVSGASGGNFRAVLVAAA
jgi:hypothetical protein